MKIFKRHEQQFISQVVILSMLFGFAAGVVGQIVADVYIDPYDQDSLYNLNTNQNVSIEIPELSRVKRFLGIQQDFEVNNSIKKVAPALAGIYLKKQAAAGSLNQIYLAKDLQVNSFILTSDGWLVSLSQVLNNHKKEQLAVIVDKKIYSIEEMAADSTTGVVFFKISADNLSVVNLGDSDEAALGQLAVVLNAVGEAVVTNIEHTDYQDITSVNGNILSSEQYVKSILLTNGLAESYLGSPLLNLGGEVVGMIKEIDSKNGIVTAIPINQFRFVILDVLKNNLIKRPYLGVSYIDLSSIVGLDESLTQGQGRGALIYQAPKSATPAAEAGLKANDIILSLDEQELNKDNNLTELIQQYKAGDEISLEILRNGETLKKNVVLSLVE